MKKIVLKKKAAVNLPPYFSAIAYVNARTGAHGKFLSVRVSTKSFRFYDEEGKEIENPAGGDYPVFCLPSFNHALTEAAPADYKPEAKIMPYASLRVVRVPEGEGLPAIFAKEGAFVFNGETKGMNFAVGAGDAGKKRLVCYVNWDSLGDEFHPLPSLPKKEKAD